MARMQAGQVSQTAVRVALFMLALDRKPGWHERLPEGLADVTARLLLAARPPGAGRMTVAAHRRRLAVPWCDAMELAIPGVFEGIGERKIFIDAAVRSALAEGASQVLVIGAGFDTLCLRLAPAFPGVRFFEIDHPGTSAVKSRGVAGLGAPPNLSLSAADLTDASLEDVTAGIDGWESNARTVVVAEGLFLYLTVDDVQGVFASIAACTGAYSRVAFSHGLTVERYVFARAWLRAFGEPWLSSCSAEALPAYIGAGWTVLQTSTPRTDRDLEGFAVAERSER